MSNNRRIIHIITGLDTGGAEMMLYKLLCTMNRARFDSVVISLNDEGMLGEPIKKLGFAVHTLGMRSGRSSLEAVWRLWRIIRSFNPDIIQGWMYHGNLAASINLVFPGKKVPVLWNMRQSLYNLEYEKKGTVRVIKIGAALSKRTAKIIYNSRVSVQQHQALGYAASRTVVIPNGFDVQKFRPSLEARKKLLHSLQLPRQAFLIGLIARYHPMKDHANFFKAAAKLSRKTEQAQFILAGRGVEPDNPVIVEMVEKHQLGQRIHLLGERRDIPDIMAGLDVLTLSSYYGEGFPNVVGEAMACKVPCVVTDVGDSAWIIGETGKVIPPRDSEALESAWMDLIAMEPERRKQSGEAARKRVMENFSIMAVVRQYERLYDGVLEKSC